MEPGRGVRFGLAAIKGLGEGAVIRPPLQMDYGYQTTIGSGTFINVGAVILDAPDGDTLAMAAPLLPHDPAPVMTIGRLHYEGGGDWYANPSSLPNLLQAIRARTALDVAAQERVVTLRDGSLAVARWSPESASGFAIGSCASCSGDSLQSRCSWGAC